MKVNSSPLMVASSQGALFFISGVLSHHLYHHLYHHVCRNKAAYSDRAGRLYRWLAEPNDSRLEQISKVITDQIILVGNVLYDLTCNPKKRTSPSILINCKVLHQYDPPPSVEHKSKTVKKFVESIRCSIWKDFRSVPKNSNTCFIIESFDQKPVIAKNVKNLKKKGCQATVFEPQKDNTSTALLNLVEKSCFLNAYRESKIAKNRKSKKHNASPSYYCQHSLGSSTQRYYTVPVVTIFDHIKANKKRKPDQTSVPLIADLVDALASMDDMTHGDLSHDNIIVTRKDGLYHCKLFECELFEIDTRITKEEALNLTNLLLANTHHKISIQNSADNVLVASLSPCERSSKKQLFEQSTPVSSFSGTGYTKYVTCRKEMAPSLIGDLFDELIRTKFSDPQACIPVEEIRDEVFKIMKALGLFNAGIIIASFIGRKVLGSTALHEYVSTKEKKMIALRQVVPEVLAVLERLLCFEKISEIPTNEELKELSCNLRKSCPFS